MEAFDSYLDDTRYTVEQVRFVSMIVYELTANGLMEPARLFESPYVDQAATRPDLIFKDRSDADGIVRVLTLVRAHALPTGAALRTSRISTCEEVVQSLEEPLDVTPGDVRSEAHS